MCQKEKKFQSMPANTPSGTLTAAIQPKRFTSSYLPQHILLPLTHYIGLGPESIVTE